MPRRPIPRRGFFAKATPTQRTRIEEIFGWLEMVGLLRKTRHRGVARVGWPFTFGLAVYNHASCTARARGLDLNIHRS